MSQLRKRIGGVTRSQMLPVCIAIDCFISFLVMRLVVVHGWCLARIGDSKFRQGELLHDALSSCLILYTQ